MWHMANKGREQAQEKGNERGQMETMWHTMQTRGMKGNNVAHHDDGNKGRG